MKLTPGALIDAPKYYNNIGNGTHNTEMTVVLRDLQLENDNEAMPAVIRKYLPSATQILDLTNNDLTAIPDLRAKTSITTLLLSRNRIHGIDGSSLPRHLRSLVLANNGISKLGDLQGLRKSPRTLRNLVLRGNQVCYLENYRLYTLSLVPQLQTLDFSKISDDERQKARLFKSADLSKETGVNQQADQRAKTPRDKDGEVMSVVLEKMDTDVREKLKEQLANAATLEEMERIEKILTGGL
ncbi:LAFA_0G20978g1_1 [Lachancea sp. 'fantastica']|nr:LAFA_0G20978g1_1 [Lachancea sp. 'fantastica']